MSDLEGSGFSIPKPEGGWDHRPELELRTGQLPGGRSAFQLTPELLIVETHLGNELAKDSLELRDRLAGNYPSTTATPSSASTARPVSIPSHAQQMGGEQTPSPATPRFMDERQHPWGKRVWAGGVVAALVVAGGIEVKDHFFDHHSDATTAKSTTHPKQDLKSTADAATSAAPSTAPTPSASTAPPAATSFAYKPEDYTPVAEINNNVSLEHTFVGHLEADNQKFGYLRPVLVTNGTITVEVRVTDKHAVTETPDPSTGKVDIQLDRKYVTYGIDTSGESMNLNNFTPAQFKTDMSQKPQYAAVEPIDGRRVAYTNSLDNDNDTKEQALGYYIRNQISVPAITQQLTAAGEAWLLGDLNRQAVEGNMDPSKIDLSMTGGYIAGSTTFNGDVKSPKIDHTRERFSYTLEPKHPKVNSAFAAVVVPVAPPTAGGTQ